MQINVKDSVSAGRSKGVHEPSLEAFDGNRSIEREGERKS
jgi:hypothetical protein